MSITLKNAGATAIALCLYASVALAQSGGSATACRDVGDTSSVRRFPAIGAHGVQDFDTSVLFVVPDGVSSISVELWGAGGGGGGGSADAYSIGGAGGGGGASGAYVRTILAVSPGKTYALLMGHGGGGGTGGGRSTPGKDGEDSSICDGNAAMASAPGGSGGQAAPNYGKRGSGGAGRMAELSGNAPSLLRRVGSDGAKGQDALFERAGWGGAGGGAVSGSVRPTGSFGGSGGAGASRPDLAENGKPGGGGSAIVSW